MRIRIALILVLFTAVPFAAQLYGQTKPAAPGRAPDEIVLQLKWTHQFNFAGYYAAVEKGYYREAGLEVTIREGQPDMDFIGEVVSGQANYGVEMPELLIARHNGKPVVVLAAIFQHSPQILLARADSGIKSPQNLTGKKVMWREDSAAELRAMLINERVPLDQIEFMELSWDIGDLINGKVDAVHAYITDQPLVLKKAGIESMILSPLTYGIDFYGDCLFTSEKELSEHPERVKAFLTASLRGWEYAMDHPEEMMDTIGEKYGSASTREVMRNEFTHISQLMLPKLIEIGHMNPGRWKHIGDTFVQLGMLEPDYSLHGFLYDPDPRPDYQRAIKLVVILLGIISVIFAGFVTMLVFNRKLRKEVSERTEYLSTEIAERKRAEQEISVRKAEFEAIFNSISDAVVFANIDRHLMMVNPAFSKMFGYQAAEVLGKTTESFYADPEEYREQGKTRFRKNVDITQPVYEMTYRRKNGATFPAETLGTHVKNSDGEIIGFIGIMRDITKRKQDEEERSELQSHLRQAYKMEAIGTMAGGIAHDFNNILAVIIGNADMALLELPEGHPARYNIDQLSEASTKARDLVKQILAFTRQTDQMAKPINVVQAVEDSLKLFRSTIPASVQIRKNYELASGIIVSDPIQFHQLMINICANAVQAMHDKGVLEVGLTEVNLTEEDLLNQPDKKPGLYIRLSISDTGEGIDKSVIDRIFDPFFTTREVGHGTGMGLSVVHGILSSHGGFVTVESSPGRGSTFHLFFLKSDEKPIEKPEAREALPTGNERILFVDDQEGLTNLGRNMLEHVGYSVTTQSNGSEALETFRAQPDAFDLVITDMAMPGLTGKELASEILRIKPDMPIILCTGYSPNISDESGEEVGVRAICMKPLGIKQLAKTIRRVLDEK